MSDFYKILRINNNDYKIAVNIGGSGAPTTSTKGVLWQGYVDYNKNQYYICLGQNESGEFLWEPAKNDSIGENNTQVALKCFKPISENTNTKTINLDSVEGLNEGKQLVKATYSEDGKFTGWQSRQIAKIDADTNTVTLAFNFSYHPDYSVSYEPTIKNGVVFYETLFTTNEETGNVVCIGSTDLKLEDGDIKYIHLEGVDNYGVLSSTVEGNYNQASAFYAHAEGSWNVASGIESHVEGTSNVVLGKRSHAEGQNNIASGQVTHAEGASNEVSGDYGHVEGIYNKATNQRAHAEGRYTEASGLSSHTEGEYTLASGNSAHAEGLGAMVNKVAYPNEAIGVASHAEGKYTKASGEGAHVEGVGASYTNKNEATAQASHAEGYNTKANGAGSHTEGHTTIAEKEASHAEGKYTKASGAGSHAEGIGTEANPNHAKADGSHVEGYCSVAESNYSHVEGRQNTIYTDSVGAHAEGQNNKVYGANAHAEGQNNTIGNKDENIKAGNAHVEGQNNIASGIASHAEGNGTKALSAYSHAEGFETEASGVQSHAEGYQAKATNEYSHAEGFNTLASGKTSHAEGRWTEASGIRSHVEGECTIAAGNYSHVQGKFNIKDTTNTYAHIVGGGTSDTNRKNIHTIDWNGNAEFAGDVRITDANGNIISLRNIIQVIKNNSEWELVTSYTHNGNLVVQPTALDMSTGYFTCENHGLVTGDKLTAFYQVKNNDKCPIPFELVDKANYKSDRLYPTCNPVTVIDENTFMITGKSSYATTNNTHVDVTKFNFETQNTDFTGFNNLDIDLNVYDVKIVAHDFGKRVTLVTNNLSSGKYNRLAIDGGHEYGLAQGVPVTPLGGVESYGSLVLSLNNGVLYGDSRQYMKVIAISSSALTYPYPFVRWDYNCPVLVDGETLTTLNSLTFNDYHSSNTGKIKPKNGGWIQVWKRLKQYQ